MAVEFRYMYRDASNYKQFSSAVFAGALVGTAEEDGRRLRAAAEGGENFVATQVGLEPLQSGFGEFDPDDHGYHELVEDEDPEELPGDDDVTDSRTWAQFLADFEAEGRKGWDAVAECELLGIDPLATWDEWEKTHGEDTEAEED